MTCQYASSGCNYPEGECLGLCAITKSMGEKVIYTGANDSQVQWGGGDDPRNMLQEGAEYTVTNKEVHSWHTLLELAEAPGQKFNSVCFKRAAS